jgi:hypothetical protein
VDCFPEASARYPKATGELSEANLSPTLMGDSWLQRLVVRGPASEVVAFQCAVASRAKPEYVTVKPACRTQRLSFVKLNRLLPRRRARELEPALEEPWDLVVDPVRRLDDGSREITYKFQLSAFEPEEMVIEVSRLYPRLCFVSGSVAPSVDEQSSVLAHNGRSWKWRLPVRQKNAIWKKMVPEETADNGDEVSWALAEADWKMMDEVVTHWRPRMDILMARMRMKSGRAQTRVAHGRRPEK